MSSVGEEMDDQQRDLNWLLVTGDRNWTDLDLLYRTLAQEPQDTVLVHGANGDKKHWPPQYGADMQADFAARERFFYEPKAYPAQWDKFGLAAGPMRNRQMLIENPIARVVAFHDHLRTSKGTKNMVYEALKRHIPVTLVTHEGITDDQSALFFLVAPERERNNSASIIAPIRPRQVVLPRTPRDIRQISLWDEKNK